MQLHVGKHHIVVSFVQHYKLDVVLTLDSNLLTWASPLGGALAKLYVLVITRARVPHGRYWPVLHVLA